MFKLKPIAQLTTLLAFLGLGTTVLVHSQQREQTTPLTTSTAATQSPAPAAISSTIPVAQLPQAAFTLGLDQPTPVSPEITVGEFANGLKYYIQQNQEPVNRAELRLVVNVGSILENDNQVGLAHFLEHMAFNGTTNFQKHDIITFMESIGMKMGPGINASTSFDETIYQLQVPTDNPANLQTAFKIMQDWTNALTLDSSEIDLERGVVIEEWRQGQGAGSRIRDKQLPIILKDSRYATRLPIGTKENIESFDADLVRQFYKDWYRPELMAVVAIGDFDKATVEQLIKDNFAHLTNAPNARPREQFGVPAHPETLFAITADPEVPTTQVGLYHKYPDQEDWTLGGYRQRMVEQIYNSMLNLRFQEMVRKPDAPFFGAQSGNSSIVKGAGAYVLSAAVKENGIDPALTALLVEANRVASFGFTQPEFERVKTAMTRGIERQYANREERSSASYAAEMIRAYLTNESIPGNEFEVALQTRFLPTITLDEVNQVGKNWIKPTNRVVVVTMPQKDGIRVPTAAELQLVIDNAANVPVQQINTTTNDAPLISNLPQGSPVAQTRELEGGLTEWTLANGIKVVVKPTDFKDDEIVFAGSSPGGTSLLDDADWIPGSTAVTMIASGGLGAFNATDLQRKLTGKVASVAAFIGTYEEGVRGSSAPADLETMMQLLYLRMTQPRADQDIYQVIKNQLSNSLKNRDSNPGTAMSDAFGRIYFADHLRTRPFTLAQLDQTDLQKSLNIYQERLGDATDATFVFVGKIDLNTLKPLVETYIGGLPVSGRKETWRDVGIRPNTALHTELVKKGLEPQSRTRIAFSGDYDAGNQYQRAVLVITADILQTRLREVLREQLSGTYGVSVSPGMNLKPFPNYQLQIEFASDPARADELTTALFAELEKIKASGPKVEELATSIQTLLRAYETNVTENNGYWLGSIMDSYSSGIRPGAADILSYGDTVKTVTLADVQRAFQLYFPSDKYLRVTLLPENQ